MNSIGGGGKKSKKQRKIRQQGQIVGEETMRAGGEEEEGMGIVEQNGNQNEYFLQNGHQLHNEDVDHVQQPPPTIIHQPIPIHHHQQLQSNSVDLLGQITLHHPNPINIINSSSSLPNSPNQFAQLPNQNQRKQSTANGAGSNNSSTAEFVCKFCGKRYAYASSLYVHTRLHTGERPFK